MFAEIGNQILNLDHVVRFEAVSRDSQGRERFCVHFAGGESLIVGATYSQIARHFGAVIPAIAGYRVIEAYPPPRGETDTTFSESAIVAFRITGDFVMPAIPVTPSGMTSDHYAIVEPSGRCYDADGDYESADQYRATVAKCWAEEFGTKVEGPIGDAA